MRFARVLAFFFVVATAGCGGRALTPCPGPDCACVGQSCACDVLGSCRFDSTGSANWTCGTGAYCEGSCDSSCNIDCAVDSTCAFDVGPSTNLTCTGASCDFLVGASSNVRCIDGASCVIECTGPCNVDCETASSCLLTCSGEPTRGVTGSSAQCS